MRRFGWGLVGLAWVMAGPIRAEDSCATLRGGQFYDRLSYCVSSVLPGQAGNGYGPENLLDGDDRTAWCEGMAGHGEGTQIVIQVAGGRPVTRLYLRNGYQKSASIYGRNSRARDLRIGVDGGPWAIIRLEDRMGEQRVDLPGPVRGDLVIQIGAVYGGSKWDDTCLTELHLDFEAGNVAPPVASPVAPVGPPVSGGGGISVGGGSPGFGSFPKLKN